ncbi:MAG: acetyl-CoA hydrolase/transferase C-terminal domain-containing protein [Pseudomonadota bacterium]
MPQRLTARAAMTALADALKGRGRVYVPGCSGEPLLFAEAFAQDPEIARGLTFFGVWIPGANRTDYAALHPEASSEVFFLSPDFRASFDRGAASFRPMPYTAMFQWMEGTALDAALLHVSPPDDQGQCSLGVAADFTPAVMHRAPLKIAHVNPAMPFVPSAPRIPFDAFDIVVEEEAPLVAYDCGRLNPAFEDIARHITGLIEDGDTLQFGLGKVQTAVLSALQAKKNLRIHSGMVSDPVLGLLDTALADEPNALTTGVALGSEALYQRLAEDKRANFAPVSHTHNIRVLASLENFTAINSVVDIDLFGQANGEFIGGRQISGAGGLVDFLRGARIAPGGKAIVALNAATKDGATSRIVPRLPEGVPPSIARGDIGFVVTEHGIANIGALDIDARAAALIEVAAPAFRDTLSNAWDDMRKAM